jgi:amino acid transporter
MLIFVALNLNQFARRSATAGSMHGYAAGALGGPAGAIAGWALLWAYGFVAAAVLGAMAHFAGILLGNGAARVPAMAIAGAIAASVSCKRSGAMRPNDLAISVIAVGFLLVPAVTLFHPVPPPPQRYFAYTFVAFLAAG